MTGGVDRRVDRRSITALAQLKGCNPGATEFTGTRQWFRQLRSEWRAMSAANRAVMRESARSTIADLRALGFAVAPMTEKEPDLQCALCGADLKTSGSLAPIDGIFVCSHPSPPAAIGACRTRALARIRRLAAWPSEKLCGELVDLGAACGLPDLHDGRCRTRYAPDPIGERLSQLELERR